MGTEEAIATLLVQSRPSLHASLYRFLEVGDIVLLGSPARPPFLVPNPMHPLPSIHVASPQPPACWSCLAAAPLSFPAWMT